VCAKCDSRRQRSWKLIHRRKWLSRPRR
jgi:hypothetical protein